MRKAWRNIALALAALFAWSLFPGADPAQSQLVLVTSRYRVVNIDQAEQRIGIALEDANPNKRQNWLYIKPDTRISKRSYYGNGLFRDEMITFNGVWTEMSRRKGKLIKIHGGRDWDGSIDAKSIWL
ncbi:MAG: hypothetical protein HY319_21635 [Armatimonadetes bacterium]|nr:hypothetical protein [Armatimonadota bacterium]